MSTGTSYTVVLLVSLLALTGCGAESSTDRASQSGSSPLGSLGAVDIELITYDGGGVQFRAGVKGVLSNTNGCLTLERNGTPLAVAFDTSEWDWDGETLIQRDHNDEQLDRYAIGDTLETGGAYRTIEDSDSVSETAAQLGMTVPAACVPAVGDTIAFF